MICGIRDDGRSLLPRPTSREDKACHPSRVVSEAIERARRTTGRISRALVKVMEPGNLA
jgi:hypothetical protein